MYFRTSYLRTFHPIHSRETSHAPEPLCTRLVVVGPGVDVWLLETGSLARIGNRNGRELHRSGHRTASAILGQGVRTGYARGNVDDPR